MNFQHFFSTLFAAEREGLDLEQFQACFMAWVQAIAREAEGEVVATDGKSLRRYLRCCKVSSMTWQK